jgi:hypothetical protein
MNKRRATFEKGCFFQDPSGSFRKKAKFNWTKSVDIFYQDHRAE